MRPGVLAFFLLLYLGAYAQAPLSQTATPLPSGRQMYGVAVVGDFLYVIGGNLTEPDELFTRAVEKAPIFSDGSLGPWESTTPLPLPRSYINNTTLVLGDIIYVVQGLNGTTDEKLRTILWARQGENGHLSEWQESLPCPAIGVSCGVAVATPGYIHLIGGSVGNSVPTDKVWSVPLGAQGEPLRWEEGPALPVPLWFHCAGVARGHVWVWSGLKEKAPKTVERTIWIAPITPEGRLGAWKDLGAPLERGFYSASCAVSGDYLISFCPRYEDASLSGDIWFASINDQGLSPWACVPAQLPIKLYHGIAADFRRGFVFLPGGRTSRESYRLDPTVYTFRLNGGSAAAASASAPAPAAPTGANDASPASSAAAAPPAALPPAALPATVAVSTATRKFPGFLTFEEAREAFRQRQGAPSVLYFHNEGEDECRQQAMILQLTPVAPYADKVIFAEIPLRENPELAQRYGVAKAPCWLFFDGTGNLIDQKTRMLRAPEIAHSINLILP